MIEITTINTTALIRCSSFIDKLPDSHSLVPFTVKFRVEMESGIEYFTFGSVLELELSEGNLEITE
jgi:hypothetical protein